ncbi:hypothetical protein BOQ62_17910, partial [Chryseobacterium sp. CH21]|uniref:hypothetical protein n=1 Tax=Chryseobacterium sp. CH21 TaxID=713556 RepID=UPI001026A316
EGFGHAYTSPKGYIGNFTPFLDSLSQKSLFWENNLSSAGRTFGALPSLTGSAETPNLVFVVLEGFGHAYTSPKGYIGNFTPFLDSLSQKSLFWE